MQALRWVVEIATQENVKEVMHILVENEDLVA